MRMIIDTADNSLIAADGRRLDLYGNEAFELIWIFGSKPAGIKNIP